MTDSNTPSPWHSGERWLHASINAVDEMESVGRRAIRPYMPKQHQAFYTNLPFLVAGVVGQDGDPWATLLQGPPGFVRARDKNRLVINSLLGEEDPALVGFDPGQSIGLLGIEPSTRRRNRANGHIRNHNRSTLEIAITETMGNCPKYIQKRKTIPSTRDDTTHSPAQELTNTSAQYHQVINDADTCFVATYNGNGASRTADASHRGGKPGFVTVAPDGTLTIPDYTGNRFFNTLGNILETHRAGLLFPNFETGHVLQLTGRADVFLEDNCTTGLPGAERVWRVWPERIVLRERVLDDAWVLHEPSPFNP